MAVDQNKPKVCVMMGGVSAEREVSLETGRNVSKALKEQGYKVVDFVLDTRDKYEIISFLKSRNIDLVFIALHGEFGEDGGVQSILEEQNIPFTGSGSSASKRCMDKIDFHRFMQMHNINIPDFWVVGEVDEGFFKNENLYPLIIKPHLGGSSIGVKVVNDFPQFVLAVEAARKVSAQVLAEKFILAREFTVGILGQRSLVPIEIKPKKKFFDYACKYSDNMTEYIVPAKIRQDLFVKMQKQALKTYRICGCRHFSRVDLLLDNQGKIYILEVNTIPGFTSHSLLPMAAAYEGISFGRLCSLIVEMASK
ncbi:MAG: D-alanine--D-alanine ligase [Thermoprotei archaeon]|nr:MAG: D-alanine--D-alanine ligase [Thermoprotei archaeon]